MLQMGRVRLGIGLGFVFILIIIPIILGQIHRSQTVLAAKIHIVIAIPTLSPTPTPIPTITPVPTVTPTPLPTNTPTPSPTPMPTANPEDIATWDKLAQCETHGNWSADTGNGYYGGLQFSQSAWEAVGGSGKASDASRDEQILHGKTWQSRRGWSAWSVCSKRLGLY